MLQLNTGPGRRIKRRKSRERKGLCQRWTISYSDLRACVRSAGVIWTLFYRMLVTALSGRIKKSFIPHGASGYVLLIEIQLQIRISR